MHGHINHLTKRTAIPDNASHGDQCTVCAPGDRKAAVGQTQTRGIRAAMPQPAGIAQCSVFG
jgi:hypothetical protein